MAKDDMTRTPLKRCSFCGKTERQVMRMVAGANNVCICNECIMLCQEIISDAMPTMHSRASAAGAEVRPPAVPRRNEAGTG